MTAFWRDRQFVLALLCGPVVWAGLAFFQLPGSSAKHSVTVYFLLVLVYPLLEEWVFRGTLQPALKKSAPFRKQFFSITLANLVTSVIFSALHLFNHSVLWAVAVFFPSLVFGWAMDRFKQLAAPVVLHVFYNAGYFLLF